VDALDKMGLSDTYSNLSGRHCAAYILADSIVPRLAAENNALQHKTWRWLCQYNNFAFQNCSATFTAVPVKFCKINYFT
jgi:hypothetical protein